MPNAPSLYEYMSFRTIKSQLHLASFGEKRFVTTYRIPTGCESFNECAQTSHVEQYYTILRYKSSSELRIYEDEGGLKREDPS